MPNKEHFFSNSYRSFFFLSLKWQSFQKTTKIFLVLLHFISAFLKNHHLKNMQNNQ